MFSKSAYYPLKPWVRSSKAMFVQSYLHMQLAKIRKKNLLFGEAAALFFSLILYLLDNTYSFMIMGLFDTQ